MKYIISKKQLEFITESIKKGDEKFENHSKIYQKRVKQKKKEIQSYIDDVILPQYNSFGDPIILKCNITQLAFGLFQHDIYIYLDVEYTANDPLYKKQLQQQLNFGQPWRSLSSFFSFIKEKLEERYNWQNRQRIGFNPQSAEYSIHE